MNCLLVIAHPRRECLCRSLAEVARKELAARGFTVTVEDLYASDFRPALSSEEWLEHSSVVTATAEMERLRAATVLVLVFPTWWFGFPAILKGWFDRVWAPGVAFEIPAGSRSLRPRLSQLEHVVAITTLGGPRWVDWLVLRQPVRRILKRGVAGVCAPQARFHYLALYSAETVNAGRYESFAGKVRKAIAAIKPSPRAIPQP